MFPVLVIWTRLHVKKTQSTNSLLHLWLPCSFLAHTWKRTKECCRHILWQWRATIYQTLRRKWSRVCLAWVTCGYQRWGHLVRITSWLCCETVYKKVLTIMIICCKIHFVIFIFVIYTNHENLLMMKIFRSIRYHNLPDV